MKGWMTNDEPRASLACTFACQPPPSLSWFPSLILCLLFQKRVFATSTQVTGTQCATTTTTQPRRLRISRKASLSTSTYSALSETNLDEKPTSWTINHGSSLQLFAYNSSLANYASCEPFASACVVDEVAFGFEGKEVCVCGVL